MNNLEICVAQTFAYLNYQLDLPKSKRIRAHLIHEDSKKTLCGKSTSGWEF